MNWQKFFLLIKAKRTLGRRLGIVILEIIRLILGEKGWPN